MTHPPTYPRLFRVIKYGPAKCRTGLEFEAALCSLPSVSVTDHRTVTAASQYKLWEKPVAYLLLVTPDQNLSHCMLNLFFFVQLLKSFASHP